MSENESDEKTKTDEKPMKDNPMLKVITKDLPTKMVYEQKKDKTRHCTKREPVCGKLIK